MNSIAGNELIVLDLFILILFAVCKYFWNLKSEIKKVNCYQQTQTKLLGEIAGKSGIDINTVSDVLAQAGIDKIKL